MIIDYVFAGGATVALLSLCIWLIKRWISSWDDRIKEQIKAHAAHLTRHDAVLMDHQVEIAVLASDQEHIRKTVDIVSADVKTLLTRGSNRSTG